MNYQQDYRRGRLDGYSADRVPAHFSRIVDVVRTYQAVFVFENERCQLERDSGVFALVLAILRFVPFVSHSVYTQSILEGAGTQCPNARRRGVSLSEIVGAYLAAVAPVLRSLRGVLRSTELGDYGRVQSGEGPLRRQGYIPFGITPNGSIAGW